MKKIIALFISVVISFSLLPLTIVAEADLSSLILAKTSTEKQQATAAKALLTSILGDKPLIQHYRDYYARVTIESNKYIPTVVKYKQQLDILDSLLLTNTLFLAKYYDTGAAGNVEQLWQAFRLELPIGPGLIIMRDAYVSKTKPGLDFSTNTKYTESSWQRMWNSIDTMDRIKNSCTDSQGLAAYNDFCLALDSLVETDVTITQGQINAKNNLKAVYPFYEAYATRITLSQFTSNQEYQRYLNSLLPQARGYINENTYRSVSTYDNMVNSLESSWTSWRLQVPISFGMHTFRDALLKTVKPQSEYDASAWSAYQSSLPSALTIIDNLKNSSTAKDTDGLDGLAVLQKMIDNLNHPSTQTPEDIAAKEALSQTIEPYRQQLARDTKAIKSQETNTFAKMINDASMLVASTTATASDYNKAHSDMDNYVLNVFHVALFVGVPFINAARKIYYTVAIDWRTYTSESWAKVSKDINQCDAIKGGGTDVQCASAYNALSVAIKNLQKRIINYIPLTVSSSNAVPGEEITVSIIIGPKSEIIYGNFNLLYDDTLMEFLSASDSRAVNHGSSIEYAYENPTPISFQKTLLTLKFRVKDYSPSTKSQLTLTADRLRDKNGYLIYTSVVNGNISIASNYVKGNLSKTGQITVADARKVLLSALGKITLSDEEKSLADYNNDGKITTTDVRKILRAAISLENKYSILFNTNGSTTTIPAITGTLSEKVNLPSDIPEKQGYVFKGWISSSGEIVKNVLYLNRDTTLEAVWTPFLSGPVKKDQIQMGGFCAVHIAYAVEEDFKMLSECDITLIIMDYDRNNIAVSNQCLRWAEKYGIKVLIHDYDLLGDTNLSVREILNYTSSYINSPSFAGNNYYDEPSNAAFDEIGMKTSLYKQALPEYDMHVNLFPNSAVVSFIGISYQTYLNEYIQKVTGNHICSDPYPFRDENGKTYVSSEYYMTLDSVAKIARDNNLDHWMYPESITGMEGYFPDLNGIRFQLYTGLAFGVSKFMYFCYDVPGYNGLTYSAEVYAMRDYAHRYTEIWDYAQYVHNEIMPFADIYSNYSYQKTGVYKIGTAPDYVNKMSTYSSSNLTNISSNQCLLIGEFSEKSGIGKAFVISNASELRNAEAANISFKLPYAKKVTAYVDGIQTVLSSNNGTYSLSLKTCQGSFITVEY